MDRETLRKLEMLNQLSLTDAQKESVIAFFAAREQDLARLEKIDTASTERMVHVMPMTNVLREDERKQPFTRDELLSAAPERSEDSWVVPRLVK